jgi:hypothetical protein
MNNLLKSFITTLPERAPEWFDAQGLEEAWLDHSLYEPDMLRGKYAEHDCAESHGAFWNINEIAAELNLSWRVEDHGYDGFIIVKQE